MDRDVELSRCPEDRLEALYVEAGHVQCPGGVLLRASDA
jgi:hypothetical protein